MAQTPQTTMKRVASELGVSVTTISKVWNKHGDISEATRDRVLAKIEELGYQRNAVARSLTLRRTQTGGIVIPDLMHSFFVEVISGIGPPDRARSELARLRRRQVDGIVLASAHGSANDDLLEELTDSGTGLVMIDRDDH